MDRDYWIRNFEQKREEWRAQRVEKMGARLQLNSTRPRNISSSVLGFGNYRQHAPMQLSHRQHNEGPRFNNIDQRWNSDYSYSGYREQNMQHKQYHHADHRGRGTFHHGYHRKAHFSSQKSLYKERKPNNVSNRISSSCSTINSSGVKVENVNVSQLPQLKTEISCENLVFESNVVVGDKSSSLNDSGENMAVISQTVDITSVIVLDTQNNEKILDSKSQPEVCENDLSESCSHTDGKSAVDREVETVIEGLGSVTSEEPCENYLPELYRNPDKCSIEDAESIGKNSEIHSHVELNGDKFSEPHVELNGDKFSEPHVEFVDVRSSIPLDVKIGCDKVLPKLQVEIHEYLEPELQDVVIDVEESAIGLSGEISEESLIPESPMRTGPECLIAVESIAEKVGDTTEIIPKVCEILSEPITSSKANSTIADEFFELELSLNCEEDAEVVVEGSASERSADADEASEQSFKVKDSESYVESSDEEMDENDGFLHTESAHVVPVALIVTGDSETEASILVGDENDIAREIENVGSKLANISIVNKDVPCSDIVDTPKKRERRNVLLDATNILPSSVIKYSVQEIRKNDESEIVVTPVRRSLRISSMTPVSNKNICVQNLKELTPEVIKKMKFIQNPAIKIPPDC